ncbi:hypothetical protein [Demequina rhizosphaerae]|uniref:hypothetical protein n=1 Tax=Demequina rhizosphaerae TaxID=1638985 RepID=UPI000782BDEF|nr:hypothetical protein [Demequina rhizosphaerae]
MTTAIAADAIAELRQRRRDMRRELARVRWWRRLVHARRDLALALLAQPEPHSSAGLDLSWEALAAGAPTSTELAAAVWPDAEDFSAGTLAELDTLDARLGEYESRVAATLDNVTAQMVRALAHAHRAESATKEG